VIESPGGELPFDLRFFRFDESFSAAAINDTEGVVFSSVTVNGSSIALEIVGLAFEFSDDDERNRRVLRRFAEHHGIDYPLLLAGGSDKAEAAKTVPDLSAVLSYPTTVFIGRDGAVHRIHSGFAGPGTGDHHQKLVTQFEKTIATLLAEPAPTTP